MKLRLASTLNVHLLLGMLPIRDALAIFGIAKSLENSSASTHHALKLNLKYTETESDIYGSISTTESSAGGNDIEYSEEFINCDGGHAPVEKDNYQALSNGSVYVPKYERVFNITDYVITNFTLYICHIFFPKHDAKFFMHFEIISLIGTVISSVCIVLHILMFLYFEKLRNLPGYCLFSLCKALLIAYIFIFSHSFSHSKSDCTAIGIIKQYAFLASFFWMNVMSYDIWRSLRMATCKLRLAGDRPMLTRFAMYSTYSWGTPLLITVVGLIVNSTDVKDEYRLIMDPQSCWFVYRQALLIYFAVPIFVLLSLNALLFVGSIHMIRSATMNTAENKADLWSRFVVSIRLAIVMGMMWIFGVLFSATDEVWLAYLSAIFSTLQGVFIFFSFTFTENVRREWRRKKSSLNTTQTSSSHQSTAV